MSDYVVMVDEQAKVFLGGPPLVQDGHRRGVRRRVARRRRDARAGLRPGRLPRRRRARRDPDRPPDRRPAELAQARAGARTGPSPSRAYDAEELLGLIPTDLKEPFDPREVIARDASTSSEAFDEFKPLYGPSLVTGWARMHGHPIGILANAQGVLFSEEAQKAAQFIQLANQTDTPLLFLHNTTGYMVGAEYEQGGIIKHGAMMINAVANSRGAAPVGDDGRVLRRRATTACAAAPTTRGSCSPGRRRSPR